MVSIGVFVHEWGHALGLPDLYDTDGGGEGLGNWCVMATGPWGGNDSSPWKPVHLSAWGKMELGWLNPTAVRRTSSYSIPQVETNSKAYWLIGRQRTFKEYFLIENRRKTGFDSLMYNQGLFIYHIDDSVITARRSTNRVNAGGTGWKYGVALEQADGSDHLFSGTNRGDAGDPFPGSSNNTNFDSTATNPNSRTNYPTASTLITGSFVKNIPSSSQSMACTLSSGAVGLFTGGPDASGYRWIDSDTSGGPTYSWIDISGSGTTFGAGDEARYTFTLPYSFNFYGTSYTQVWVSTNGWLSFGTDPGTNAPNNVTIPNTATPNRSVFVFWDDLNLVPADNSNIYYQVFGSSPNRYCVVTWKDARHKSGSQPTNQVTFQAILNENGRIVLQYKDCALGDTLYNWGKSATVGIENTTGTVGLQYLFNGSPVGNLLASERGIQFFIDTSIVPPTATTNAATNITSSSATLNGTVNPNNASTIVRFVYGTTSGTYTDSIVAAQSPVNGTSAVAVSANLSSLLPGQTYYYRAVATNVNGYVVGSAEESFTIPKLISHMDAGWNLISLSLTVSDRRKSVLFPSAISDAFTYSTLTNAYVTRDTLQYGEGYWIKFAAAETLHILGSYRTVDTISVSAGWNMICAISFSVAVSNIEQIPSNNVSSQYFDYSPFGYMSVSVLQPMRGYWVKVKEAGRLILNNK